MTSLIFALWCAGIAARAYAAFRIWREGLLDRFPTLFALLVVLTAQSGIGLALLTHSPTRYAQAYPLIAWTAALMEGFAVTGVFWAVAEFYPRFRFYGTILLGVLGCVAAAICWAIGYLSPPPEWRAPWHFAVWAQRAISAIMLCALCGSRVLLPKVRGIPVRTSARRAADILAIHIGLILVSAWATTMALNALASMTVVINGAILGVLCAVLLTRKSDIYQPAPLEPQIPTAEADANLERLWDSLRDYTRMLDQK